MKAVKPWAVGVQLLVVGVVWLRWPRIVHWLAAQRPHPRGRGRAAAACRHRVVMLLLVMVLTLGAGLPFSLLTPHGG